ncbi:hypothetical protein PG985_000667 [Apiospora marii]|uniref:Uncharacterized protein n=1 Tax=Apiospora marii TaxID=335849 RepID=A0ABR1R2N3_9PEZI
MNRAGPFDCGNQEGDGDLRHNFKLGPSLGRGDFAPSSQSDGPAQEDVHCAGMRKLEAANDWDGLNKHSPFEESWRNAMVESFGRVGNAFTMDE